MNMPEEQEGTPSGGASSDLGNGFGFSRFSSWGPWPPLPFLPQAPLWVGDPGSGEKQPSQKCTMPELEAATQMLSLAKTLASLPCITVSNILGYHLCASQVVLVAKKPPANAGDLRDAVWIPGSGRSLEEGMATHSSILALRILWTEDPGGLQFIGSKMSWAQLKHAWVPFVPFNSVFTNLKFISKGNHIITLSSLFMVYNPEYNVVTKINVIQTMRSAP